MDTIITADGFKTQIIGETDRKYYLRSVDMCAMTTMAKRGIEEPKLKVGGIGFI